MSTDTTSTTVDREELARRVHNGLLLLDYRLPGWVDKINVDLLDMRSPCQCVLGQTQTHDGRNDPFSVPYLRMRTQLGLTDQGCVDLGFEAAPPDVPIEVYNGTDRGLRANLLAVDLANEEYRVLTELWRNVITARRQRAAEYPGSHRAED